MAYFPVNVQPGIHTDISAYALGQNNPTFIDGQNVRFVNGFLTSRGGAINGPVTCSSSDGIPRNILVWQDNMGRKIIAIGTSLKLLIVREDVCYDITPSGITSVGRDAYSSGTGYGVGPYGIGTYGTPRPLSDVVVEPTLWSLALFGEDLIAVHTGNRPFYFDYSAWTSGNPQKAVPFTSLTGADHAPIGARVVAVSEPDRHIVMGGVDPVDPSVTAINPLEVRWAHMGSAVDWHPDSTDTAGDTLLEEGTEIVAMAPTRGGVIILTDFAAYQLQYVGGDDTFGPVLIGTGCGAVSANSLISVNGIAYWMSNNEFYTYAGGQAEVLPCSLKYAKVFDVIDRDNLKFVFAGHNQEFNEITWHFKVENELEYRYVAFNYEAGYWTAGINDITCWADANGVYDKPITFHRNGFMRIQETGDSEAGSPLLAEATTTPFAVAPDNEVIQISRFVPDFHELNGAVRFTLSGRDRPSSEMVEKPTFIISGDTPKKDILFRIRQAKFEISSTSTPFQLGLVQFEGNVVSKE